MALDFDTLQAATAARQAEWDTGGVWTLAHTATELAGEAGEACNVIKKLERERLGLPGSRDTLDHLAEELGDVVICALVAAHKAGIDLGAAVARKWNLTSRSVGLKTLLPDPDALVLTPEQLASATLHYSDCATHNEPASPAGPCDCGVAA